MDIAQLTAEYDEEKRVHKNNKKKLASMKKELEELRDEHGSVTSEGSSAHPREGSSAHPPPVASKSTTPVKKSFFSLGRK